MLLLPVCYTQLRCNISLVAVLMVALQLRLNVMMLRSFMTL